MSTLIIKFTDTTSSFTHGVEFGRLLEKMERGDTCIHNNGFPVHAENVEVLKITCQHYGYLPVFGQEENGWVEFQALQKLYSEN